MPDSRFIQRVAGASSVSPEIRLSQGMFLSPRTSLHRNVKSSQ